MANEAAALALAKRLIDANGRSITIVQLAKTAQDPSRPWRGPTNPRAPALRSVTGFGCFVPLGGSDLGVTFPDDAPGTQVLLFPAADDLGLPLEDFDEIIDGSARWAISNVQVLQPGAKRLLYYFLVQK